MKLVIRLLDKLSKKLEAYQAQKFAKTVWQPAGRLLVPVGKGVVEVPMSAIRYQGAGVWIAGPAPIDAGGVLPIKSVFE
jgi:hypothetical protein